MRVKIHTRKLIGILLAIFFAVFQSAIVSVAAPTDPGNWYVHRQLLGGATAPNYSYTIDHNPTTVTGQNKICPATGAGFTAIEGAAEAVHCMQSADNTCPPCINPPRSSTLGFNWYTHRDGTDFSNYTYRINHVFSAKTATHSCCPGSAGYPRTEIGKATQAMINFQKGTRCP